MANISTLLARILTTRYGKDMRQDLHDAIEATNNDTETALGKTLAFDNSTRKLTLKAKDNSVLSETTISGGTSGSTVTWNQIKQSGEKIAKISIDGVETDVYASAGGGGGGGAVDTVNGVAPDANGNVELKPSDIGAAECESIGKFTDTRITESGDVRVTESGDVRECELDVVGYVDSQIPTKTSDLTNDSGFITSSALPTVNNGTLTIQQNGNTLGTFTANQSGNTTVNITAGNPSTISGAFTANTSFVPSGSLDVKQYGNVISINGYVYDINGTTSNDGEYTLGYISGVSLPSSVIWSLGETGATGSSADTIGDNFARISLESTGALKLRVKTGRTGGFGIRVNLTYIV